MAEDYNVKIEGWPDEAAKVEHDFKLDEPCPVSISFEKTPANVFLQTSRDQPIYADMNMRLSAKEPVPICVKVCEPICARSDYRIGIEIFDRPVATITVQGITKIFGQPEEA